MTSETDLAKLAAGLSAGERRRLLYGRSDWGDLDWQDHCGDPECEYCDGVIDFPDPHNLSEEDKALRKYLETRNV